MSGPIELDGVAQPDTPGEPEVGADEASSPPAIDRRAALSEGAPGIPSRFLWWVLGGALVLTLGGLLGEHLFSAAGLNPAPTTTTTTPGPTRVAPPDTPAPPAPNQALGAALPSFMGLSTPSPRPAPAFTLTDQAGRALSLPTAPPRVVVLTFFDAPCNDICPVLASEIQRADADLGAQAVDVEFVTVNTDPKALAASPTSAALGSTGIGALPNWHMVTGSLATLNAVWKAYGISVSVSIKTGLEAHSNVIDFIDPGGFVRYRATPFADESSNGVYTLAAAAEARWGQGIATYAGRLIGQ